MTFAKVGSYIDLSGIGQGTFTLNPVNVNDLILVEILVNDTTVTCTGLSGGNCTWTPYIQGVSVGSGVDHRNATIFAGRTTATGAATATPTYSGTPTGVTRGGAREWSSTVGQWILDTSGNMTGGATLPSLTPQGPGELYAVYLHDSGTATAGNTAGYTYDIDAVGNAFVSNEACTSAAQQPNIGDAGNAHTGVAILVMEIRGRQQAPVPPASRMAARKGRLASILIKPPTVGGPPAPFFPPRVLLRGAAAAVKGKLTAARGQAGRPSPFIPPQSPLKGPAAARPGRLTMLRGLPGQPSPFIPPRILRPPPGLARKGILSAAAAPPPVVHPSVPAPFFAPHSPAKGSPARSRSVLTGVRAPAPVPPPPFVPRGQQLRAPDDKPYLKKLFYLL